MRPKSNSLSPSMLLMSSSLGPEVCATVATFMSTRRSTRSGASCAVRIAVSPLWMPVPNTVAGPPTTPRMMRATSVPQVSKIGRSQSTIGSLKPIPSRSRRISVANDASPSRNCANPGSSSSSSIGMKRSGTNTSGGPLPRTA